MSEKVIFFESKTSLAASLTREAYIDIELVVYNIYILS